MLIWNVSDMFWNFHEMFRMLQSDISETHPKGVCAVWVVIWLLLFLVRYYGSVINTIYVLVLAQWSAFPTPS